MPTPKKAASAKNALSKPVQPDAALAATGGIRRQEGRLDVRDD